MQSTVATPRSRISIREYATLVRKSLDIENAFEFPIMFFLEHVLEEIFEGFCYDIVPDEEMGNRAGETFPELNLIKIKESVYEGALRGNPRDRFTIAHEIGHLFLHRPGSVSYARADKKIKPYQDPEWQANTFAGELLVPMDLIRGLSANHIADKCKVSFQVANIQLNSIK